MKKTLILVILAIVLGFVNITTATVLTFEDLDTGAAQGYITESYHGYDFTTSSGPVYDVLWVDTNSYANGYFGTVSGDITLINANYGDIIITATNGSDFTFGGVHSRIFWSSGTRPVNITGFKDNNLVWEYDFLLIDAWQYISGTDIMFDELHLNLGNKFFIDDLELSNQTSSVPEPATMLLLGTGLLGMGTLGRKKLVK